MRSVAAGALEVGLRGVKPDDRTTPLRQRRRYNTRATPDVQHPVASFDPGEIEKWTRQAAAPSRHEVLVGSGIGRQEQGRRESLQNSLGRSLSRFGRAPCEDWSFFSAINKNGEEFSGRLVK